MPGRNIVVIGGSAGSIEALIEVVRDLPEDLPAAVFVVVHFPPDSSSVLPQILNRAGRLPAAHVTDEEEIRPGCIYVAAPGKHLLVGPKRLRSVIGPTENGHRPAIDPLFRTAARSYGERVVGVVLSGTMDDGTAGLYAVKRQGGIALVQDPDDALYPGMPRSAMEHVTIDRIAPARDLASCIASYVREDLPDGRLMEKEEDSQEMEELDYESEIAELDLQALETEDRPGEFSPFACPKCGGTLNDVSEGSLTRFRCRVGHAFTADNLMNEQADAVETALWVALRALEESASLSQKLERKMRKQGSRHSAERFRERSEEARQRAQVIRQYLLRQGEPSPDASLPGRAEDSAAVSQKD
jgi:two-component system chemotaxis response regulator CheB